MSNKITITGKIGRDPELRYTGQNGLAVCTISVGATPRRKSPVSYTHLTLPTILLV